jgi:hypothetical protein
VRIKGIFQAILTAHQIEQLARKNLGTAVDFEVNNPLTRTVETLHLTFHGINNHGMVIGHTDKKETVLIKLGDVAERQQRHPSVVISVREPAKSVGLSANSINDISKRR